MRTRRLVRALRAPLDRKLTKPSQRAAWLGNAAGQVAAGGTMVYITLLDGTETAVFNNRVAPLPGLAVWVGYSVEQPNLYQVLSTRTATPLGVDGGAGQNYAPASRYRWGLTEDPVLVELRAFMPLRVSMWSGMLVQIWRGLIWTGAAWALVPTQTVDLTSHKPATAGKAAYVLITISTAGAVVTTKGSEVDIAVLAPGATPYANIPAVPDGTARVLAAVRVYAGQTAVLEGMTGSTDIVDLRGAGWEYGGGTGGVSFDDEEGNPADVDATMAADGTSSYAARRDHRHQLGAHTHTESEITDLDHTDTASIHDDASGEINALTEKATPAGADLLIIEDSAASYAKKKVQISNLGGGVGAFTGLADVPADYAGDGSKLVRVKADESGLEFIAPPAGTGDVVGPATSTDGHLAVWDGTDSKTLKDGGTVPTGGTGSLPSTFKVFLYRNFR